MFNTVAFTLYIFVTAYTPGPNNILSMSNAARLGLRRALPFNAGMLCGLVVVMGLCAAFSAVLYVLMPKIALPMKLLGAVYMLYLGWKIYRSTLADGPGQYRATFAAGMLLQFVNVKIIIYGLTAMSVYIVPVYSSPPLLAIFALLLAFTCCSANLCWALFGTLFYRLFSRHQRLINTLMALSLVYCAISLFF